MEVDVCVLNIYNPERIPSGGVFPRYPATTLIFAYYRLYFGRRPSQFPLFGENYVDICYRLRQVGKGRFPH